MSRSSQTLITWQPTNLYNVEKDAYTLAHDDSKAHLLHVEICDNGFITREVLEALIKDLTDALEHVVKARR